MGPSVITHYVTHMRDINFKTYQEEERKAPAPRATTPPKSERTEKSEPNTIHELSMSYSSIRSVKFVAEKREYGVYRSLNLTVVTVTDPT